jgi:broad specificity phosphatase PhoE
MGLRLWLVRHGQSTWNEIGLVQGWADPPLSELGKWQAEQVAKRLALIELTAIYSSTLQRAFQTARIISEWTGVVPSPDPRLREHGMGEATAMEWGRKAFFTRWPFLTEIANQGKPILAYIPGAEPLNTFIRRVNCCICVIRNTHSEEDVAIVAHGGVFRHYLADLLHASLGEAEFSFSNASLSQVEFDEDNFAKIRFVNDCTHLHHHTIDNNPDDSITENQSQAS